MMSPRPCAAAERAESSPVLISEGLLTPMQQSSFSSQISTVVRSPAAPQRGAFGLLVFALCLVTFEAYLTVSQLRNPNYEGSVNHLRIILENGKIAQAVTVLGDIRGTKKPGALCYHVMIS